MSEVECYMMIERGLVPLEELTHSEAIDAVRQLGRELHNLYDRMRIDNENFFTDIRKKADPKPPEVMAAIRAQAWATRRAKYGAHGHG
jgi:hypothetical protein